MKFVSVAIKGLFEGFFDTLIVSLQVALIYYIVGLTLYESCGVVAMMMIYDIKKSVSGITTTPQNKDTQED